MKVGHGSRQAFGGRAPLLQLVLPSLLLLPSPGVAQGGCLAAATRALGAEGSAVVLRDQGFLAEDESRSMLLIRDPEPGSGETAGEPSAEPCLGLLAVSRGHLREIELRATSADGELLAIDDGGGQTPYAYLRICGPRALRVTLRGVAGQGPWSLLELRPAPEALPELVREAGACFAPATSAAALPGRVGPPPPGPTLEEARAAAIVRQRGRGLALVGAPIEIRLNSMERHEQELSLEAGCHAIMAVGDPSVADLNLSLRGADGRSLGVDRGPEREGEILLCLPRSATLRVELHMRGGAGSANLLIFRQEWQNDEENEQFRGIPRIRFEELRRRLRARGLRARILRWGWAERAYPLSLALAQPAGSCVAVGLVPDQSLARDRLSVRVADQVGSLLAADSRSSEAPLVFACSDVARELRVSASASRGGGRFAFVVGEAR